MYRPETVLSRMGRYALKYEDYSLAFDLSVRAKEPDFTIHDISYILSKQVSSEESSHGYFIFNRNRYSSSPDGSWEKLRAYLIVLLDFNSTNYIQAEHSYGEKFSQRRKSMRYAWRWKSTAARLLSAAVSVCKLDAKWQSWSGGGRGKFSSPTSEPVNPSSLPRTTEGRKYFI